VHTDNEQNLNEGFHTEKWMSLSSAARIRRENVRDACAINIGDPSFIHAPSTVRMNQGPLCRADRIRVVCTGLTGQSAQFSGYSTGLGGPL
jgi:hypothetical protein